MDSVDERVTTIEHRVKKMDTDLKQHFTEFRAFVVETVDGLEKRLTKRLDGIDNRLDGIDRRLDGVDQRLDGIDGRLDHVDKRLNGIDAKLVGIDAKLDTLIARGA